MVVSDLQPEKLAQVALENGTVNTADTTSAAAIDPTDHIEARKGLVTGKGSDLNQDNNDSYMQKASLASTVDDAEKKPRKRATETSKRDKTTTKSVDEKKRIKKAAKIESRPESVSVVPAVTSKEGEHAQDVKMQETSPPSPPPPPAAAGAVTVADIEEQLTLGSPTPEDVSKSEEHKMDVDKSEEQEVDVTAAALGWSLDSVQKLHDMMGSTPLNWSVAVISLHGALAALNTNDSHRKAWKLTSFALKLIWTTAGVERLEKVAWAYAMHAALMWRHLSGKSETASPDSKDPKPMSGSENIAAPKSKSALVNTQDPNRKQAPEHGAVSPSAATTAQKASHLRGGSNGIQTITGNGGGGGAKKRKNPNPRPSAEAMGFVQGRASELSQPIATAPDAANTKTKNNNNNNGVGRPKRKRYAPEWMDDEIILDGNIRTAMERNIEARGPSRRLGRNRYKADQAPRYLPRWGGKRRRSRPYGNNNNNNNGDDSSGTPSLDEFDAAAVAGLTSLGAATVGQGFVRLPSLKADSEMNDVASLRKTLTKEARKLEDQKRELESERRQLQEVHTLFTSCKMEFKKVVEGLNAMVQRERVSFDSGLPSILYDILTKMDKLDSLSVLSSAAYNDPSAPSHLLPPGQPQLRSFMGSGQYPSTAPAPATTPRSSLEYKRPPYSSHMSQHSQPHSQQQQQYLNGGGGSDGPSSSRRPFLSSHIGGGGGPGGGPPPWQQQHQHQPQHGVLPPPPPPPPPHMHQHPHSHHHHQQGGGGGTIPPMGMNANRYGPPPPPSSHGVGSASGGMRSYPAAPPPGSFAYHHTPQQQQQHQQQQHYNEHPQYHQSQPQHHHQQQQHQRQSTYGGAPSVVSYQPSMSAPISSPPPPQQQHHQRSGGVYRMMNQRGGGRSPGSNMVSASGGGASPRDATYGGYSAPVVQQQQQQQQHASSGYMQQTYPSQQTTIPQQQHQQPSYIPQQQQSVPFHQSLAAGQAPISPTQGHLSHVPTSNATSPHVQQQQQQQQQQPGLGSSEDVLMVSSIPVAGGVNGSVQLSSPQQGIRPGPGAGDAATKIVSLLENLGPEGSANISIPASLQGPDGRLSSDKIASALRMLPEANNNTSVDHGQMGSAALLQNSQKQQGDQQQSMLGGSDVPPYEEMRALLAEFNQLPSEQKALLQRQMDQLMSHYSIQA